MYFRIWGDGCDRPPRGPAGSSVAYQGLTRKTHMEQMCRMEPIYNRRSTQDGCHLPGRRFSKHS